MTDPWEAHAEWWQREFTDGADLEYVEQILPLIAQHLPERGRLIDIGCGEGQVARLAARRRGLTALGVDGAAAQLAVARERAGGAVVLPRLGDLAVHPRRIGSTRRWPAWCSSTSPTSTQRSARSHVSCGPGGRFLLVLNHPLLQTPGSGWIDDQVLDPPEQYWRVGPYLSEGSTVEQVEKDVFIRFHHRPAVPLPQHGLGRWGSSWCAWTSRRRRRASCPRPRSTPTRRRSRGCCSCASTAAEPGRDGGATLMRRPTVC